MTIYKPRRPANRTPGAIVQKRILAYVREHGDCRAGKLAKALKFDRTVILKYVRLLEDDGLLHHIPVNRDGSKGMEYLFRAGPAPVAEPVAECDVVRQMVCRDYRPMGIVDPWMLPREFFQGAHP